MRHCQRDRDTEERDTGERRGAHPCSTRQRAPTRSPKLSRTRPSKSSGRRPSGPANSRRYMRRNVRSSSRTASRPALARDEERTFLLMYLDRNSTRLNSSHVETSYAVFCLTKKQKSE